MKTEKAEQLVNAQRQHRKFFQALLRSLALGTLALGLLSPVFSWAAGSSDALTNASEKSTSAQSKPPLQKVEIVGPPSMALVLVAPPGTNFGRESDRYARELARLVEKGADLPEGTISAASFDDPEKASAVISASSEGCAVVGSLSFYAARKSTLSLTPFLALRRPTPDGSHALTERYRVVVKKGRFHSLKELKGHTLVGTPLGEAHGFLDRAVFSGSGLTPRDFRLVATQRPLREIRKLADESRDGVVVDEAQFLSLATLPNFADVEVIYVSKPVPSLGMMLRPGHHTAHLAPAIKKAVKNLCAQKDAAPLCQSFGILGFADVDEDAVNAFVASLTD